MNTEQGSLLLSLLGSQITTLTCLTPLTFSSAWYLDAIFTVCKQNKRTNKKDFVHFNFSNQQSPCQVKRKQQIPAHSNPCAPSSPFLIHWFSVWDPAPRVVDDSGRLTFHSEPDAILCWCGWQPSECPERESETMVRQDFTCRRHFFKPWRLNPGQIIAKSTSSALSLAQIWLLHVSKSLVNLSASFFKRSTCEQKESLGFPSKYNLQNPQWFGEIIRLSCFHGRIDLFSRVPHS